MPAVQPKSNKLDLVECADGIEKFLERSMTEILRSLPEGFVPSNEKDFEDEFSELIDANDWDEEDARRLAAMFCVIAIRGRYEGGDGPGDDEEEDDGVGDEDDEED